MRCESFVNYSCYLNYLPVNFIDRHDATNGRKTILRDVRLILLSISDEGL